MKSMAATLVLFAATSAFAADSQGLTSKAIVANGLAQYQRDHDTVRLKNAYNAALKRDANYVPAYFGLALLAESEGDWAEAKKLLQAVARRSPKSRIGQLANQGLSRIERAAKLPGSDIRFDALLAQAQALSLANQL